MSRSPFAQRLFVLLAASIGVACGPEEEEALGPQPSTTQAPALYCAERPILDDGVGGGGAGEVIYGQCPAVSEAASFLVEEGDEAFVSYTVSSAGTHTEEECCYTAQRSFVSGRPYLDAGGAPVTAVAVAGDRWGVLGSALGRELSSSERARLAAGWRRDALMEHASVASFGRFALELMALGAPPDLLHAAHVAAADEVRHARDCFALARAYGAKDTDVGALDLDGSVPVSRDLADVAARTVLEGCVGESLAAALAAERARVATEPAVVDVLQRIADEEASHAALAWRAVRWMIDEGGEPVRLAVEAAFRKARTMLPVEGDDGAILAHGQLSDREARRVAEATFATVIEPLAAELSRPG